MGQRWRSLGIMGALLAGLGAGFAPPRGAPLQRVPGKALSALQNDAMESETRRMQEAWTRDAERTARDRAVALGQMSVDERLGDKAGPTVWVRMRDLAQQTGALNLGQGYPDWSPPEFVRRAGASVLAPDAAPELHQYTRTAGHGRLVELLAKRYSSHFHREVNALSEVSVTVGATQALYLCMQVLLRPGDEVLVPEPYFDLYIGQIRAAGGVPVPVPLQLHPSEGWRVDRAALEAAVTPQTRVLLVNTPHNPTGTVFCREDLEAMADLATTHDLQVISDEVYKYIRFDPQWIAPGGPGSLAETSDLLDAPDGGDKGGTEGKAPGPQEHVHFAELPGMWDRTMTVSSAGKTFSVTGWQVGWIVAPEAFTRTVHKILPLVQFNAATPLQEALSIALEEAELPFQGFGNYYGFLEAVYARKAGLLAQAIRSAGFKLGDGWGGGGLFLMAEVTHLMHLVAPEYFQPDWVPGEALGHGEVAGELVSRDLAFCRFMAAEWDVLAIPASAFFGASSTLKMADGEKRAFLRFAFCKKDDTLEAAAEKLKAFGLRHGAV